MDDEGGLLVLDGSFTGRAMVLSGTMLAQDGKPVLHRITWTPLPDGSVRQEWVSSRNGGRSWNVVFDGIYTRR